MKVTMVGTGAMYTAYNSASAQINEDLLIDMPNGSVKQLLKMKKDLLNIRYVLITHLHGDHTADIPFLMKYLNVIKENKQKVIFVGPKGIKELVMDMFESYHFEAREKFGQFLVDFIEIEDGTKLQLGDYRIEVIRVHHGDELAYGYCINDALGYTGDSGICNGVITIYEKTKVMIADISVLQGDNLHMGIDNLLSLTQIAEKKIIPTHMRDNTREEIKKLHQDNIIYKEDGDILKIEE